jgi:hypothetical protein
LLLLGFRVFLRPVHFKGLSEEFLRQRRRGPVFQDVAYLPAFKDDQLGDKLGFRVFFN